MNPSEEIQPLFDSRCPRCHSPQPHLHPAVQHEGEVQPCPDQFHQRETPSNTPTRIATLREWLERHA